MKLYIQETTETNADNELLYTVLTFESEPEKFDYIIWR